MRRSGIRPGRPALLLLLLVAGLLAACEDRNVPQAERAEIGQPAPDFILQDLSGRSWRLSDQRGKVVFLNFWATWCPPCREEMPAMEALHREMELKDRPFQMLTILSNDDPGQAARFADKLNITFPILTDPVSNASQAYGLTGVPETFIIDAKGILREKFIGPRPWNSAEAKEMLAQYFPRED